jgi:hypothetical protein
MKIGSKNLLIFFIGIILIFLSLFAFTRPAIWSVWNFSQTGQIGDTIGGITAPIINIIGAILVYISFREQVRANKIQFDALNDEKSRTETEKAYDKHQYRLDEIKKSLSELEFIVQYAKSVDRDGAVTQPPHVSFKGLNAYDEYVQRWESRKAKQKIYGEIFSTYGVLLNIQYILSGVLDLAKRIEKNVRSDSDRDFLMENLILFYRINLKELTKRLIDCFDLPNDTGKQIIELNATMEEIDHKFKL